MSDSIPKPLRCMIKNLDTKEEVRIVHGFGAGAPGSGGPWDGDRGEHDYEKHARDDSRASHVAANDSRDWRFERIRRSRANLATA